MEAPKEERKGPIKGPLAPSKLVEGPRFMAHIPEGVKRPQKKMVAPGKGPRDRPLLTSSFPLQTTVWQPYRAHGNNTRRLFLW